MVWTRFNSICPRLKLFDSATENVVPGLERNQIRVTPGKIKATPTQIKMGPKLNNPISEIKYDTPDLI